VGAIAITADRSAIVADRGANEVFAIRDVPGAALRQFLVGPQDGVSAPAGVAVSANRIHIANTGTAAILTLDSAGRLLRSQTCACTVWGTQRLKDSVFQLTQGISRTIFLLDANSAEERILFVPRVENVQ
jgi:hypothetical protein